MQGCSRRAAVEVVQSGESCIVKDVGDDTRIDTGVSPISTDELYFVFHNEQILAVGKVVIVY